MTKTLIGSIATGVVGISCASAYGANELLKERPKDVREQLILDGSTILDFTIDPEKNDSSYSNESDDAFRKLTISWSDDPVLQKFVSKQDGETKMMNSIKTECGNALNVAYGAWNYRDNLENARRYCVKSV